MDYFIHTANVILMRMGSDQGVNLCDTKLFQIMDKRISGCICACVDQNRLVIRRTD